MTAEPFLRLLSRLAENDVRCVLIGVAGANYYAKQNFAHAPVSS